MASKSISILVMAFAAINIAILAPSIVSGKQKTELAANLPELKAKWIWQKQDNYHTYNQTITASKNVDLQSVQQAVVRVTADSFYRLYINDRWVNDGPCRSWPQHYQYDVIDVASYLKAGDNNIEITARYYGIGDFHRVPQQAGLLFQMDILTTKGKLQTVISDNTWNILQENAWIPETPKVSVQMEPAELYDARMEKNQKTTKAAVLYDTENNVWQNLSPRDVPLLTKKPFTFKSFLQCNVVDRQTLNYCLPAIKTIYPGLIDNNSNISTPCGMATIINAKNDCRLTLKSRWLNIAIDGIKREDGSYELKQGRHLLMAFAQGLYGHHNKQKIIDLGHPANFTLENPLDTEFENPWCFILLPEFKIIDNDIEWPWFRSENQKLSGLEDEYNKITGKLLQDIKEQQIFTQKLVNYAKKLPTKEMFVTDVDWHFKNRDVISDGADLVKEPAGLMYDNPQTTTVTPSEKGDVELVYDLGEQNCGYYQFELVAEKDVIIDISGVEYITPQGEIQHSRGNRNCVRYITKKGVNHFTSLKRRSGRFIFITLRNLKSPIKIRNIRLIESTYPVDYIGSFACSDTALEKIWEISARTLKLCMEDTLTDCPLYEQTLWVGDARNESLYAYTAFGSADIGKRCIKLAGQSLDRLPIVGCQVPSSWDCLLPAWSFLWGISVWDYYWYTGDKEFLQEIWPAVIQNLNGSEKMLDKNGLFSAPYWNMFDWANIDQQHRTVMHCSMLLVGAIDAGIKCADILNDSTQKIWLEQFRDKLTASINKLWDENKKAYPDSIHKDDSISRSTSQHTSFLSILYDIVEAKNKNHARENILNPPDNMVTVGAPFAMQYLYEALEKMAMDDEIIKMIYASYRPMLDAGATTVWESFPTGTTGQGGFPTRSHCHAWSSAPITFLNQIILGIKQTEIGGKAFQISPRLNGLTWAKGTNATIHGPVEVSWQITDDTLNVKYSAPAGVEVKFLPNDSHQGKQIIVNGNKL